MGSVFCSYYYNRLGQLKGYTAWQRVRLSVLCFIDIKNNDIVKLNTTVTFINLVSVFFMKTASTTKNLSYSAADSQARPVHVCK